MAHLWINRSGLQSGPRSATPPYCHCFNTESGNSILRLKSACNTSSYTCTCCLCVWDNQLSWALCLEALVAHQQHIWDLRPLQPRRWVICAVFALCSGLKVEDTCSYLPGSSDPMLHIFDPIGGHLHGPHAFLLRGGCCWLSLCRRSWVSWLCNFLLVWRPLCWHMKEVMQACHDVIRLKLERLYSIGGWGGGTQKWSWSCRREN